MPEYEPEKDKGLSPSYRLNQKLDRMQEWGMERTKSWATMWQENLRYFFGDQLGHKRLHKDWEWIIVNYLWPSVQQEIAKLSKNHPKIMVNPFDEGDTEAAETWQAHLQWFWEKGMNRTGMRLEQLRAILDCKLFGYRVSKLFWENKVEWDDNQKRWVGDVRYKLWHPAEFWADADEYINEGNCGTLRCVTLEYAQTRWPAFAKKLELQAAKEPDQAFVGWGGESFRGQNVGPTAALTSGSGPDRDPGVIARAGSFLLDLVHSQNKMSRKWQGNTDRKYITISEIWLKDHQEKDRELRQDVPAEQLIQQGVIYPGDDGMYYGVKDDRPFPSKTEEWPSATVRKWSEPLYPNGRYVIRAGKDIILNPDYADQRWPFKKWPFVVVPHYLLPHMWQGSDGIQLYKTQQDMINVTASHMVNNFKQYGDPKIAVEADAIAKNPRTKKAYKIGAGAGSIIRFVRGAISGKRYEIIPPAPIPPAAQALYALFTQEFKNIVGLQDIAQGRKTPGEMSATESQWLALSSNDRIQLQSVMEDTWIKGCCELIINITQLYYEPERMIRIVGEDKMFGVQQITQRAKDAYFDVDVLPATTLPFDEDKRIEKHLRAYELLSQPIANPMLPEVLRDLEVTNWKKVLQQYPAWMQWQQFLQLYQSVSSGEVEPRDAIQALVREAAGIFEQQQARQIPTAEQRQAQRKEAEQRA